MLMRCWGHVPEPDGADLQFEVQVLVGQSRCDAVQFVNLQAPEFIKPPLATARAA